MWKQNMDISGLSLVNFSLVVFNFLVFLIIHCVSSCNYSSLIYFGEIFVVLLCSSFFNIPLNDFTKNLSDSHRICHVSPEIE